MKAWEIREGKLDLYDVEPCRPKNGETVIQVIHSGLCGSDLPKLVRAGIFPLPEAWRPGHEIVGTDSAGRLIAVDPLVPCQNCAPCSTGDTHLCHGLRRLGWDLPGGFAEQVVAPVTNIHPLPDGLGVLQGVLADPAATAIHGLRCNPVGSPGRLAVIGAGTLGLLSAIYALREGWEVTVIHRDGHPPEDFVTEAFPAPLHSPATLPSDQVFDTVIDAASGSDSAPLDLALRLVRDGGTIVVQNAYHPGVHLPVQLRDIFRRSIRLIGSFSHCRRHEPFDFALALELLHDHDIRVARWVVNAGHLADLSNVIGGTLIRSIRHVLTVHTS